MSANSSARSVSSLFSEPRPPPPPRPPTLPALLFASPSTPSDFKVKNAAILITDTLAGPPTKSKGKNKRRERNNTERQSQRKSRVPPTARRNAISLLEDSGFQALKRLALVNSHYPPICLEAVSKDFDHNEVDILIKLGQASTSYAIICLLHETLPSASLTRGTLSQLRATLLSKQALKILVPKFDDISRRSSDPARIPRKNFYIALGGLALVSPSLVIHFLEQAIGPVLGAMRRTALGLHQTSKRETEGAEDNTSKLLQHIHDGRTNNSNLKRRYSPTIKENVSLLVPESPKPALKRRKSVEARESADQSVLRRVQDSITERKLEQKQERVVDVSTAGPATPRIPDVLIDNGRNLETQAFESKLGTLPLQIDEPDLDPADEGDAGDADSDDAWKNAVSIYIQNKILSQVYDSNLIPAFTHLPAVVWTIVLGPVWGRDPLETLGDAAMQVVLTELVVDWVEALDLPASRKIALRHAILGPLQSNATFMAVLQTKGIFRLDSETIPKYPGDALEVFAGAVAKFVSLDALKLWVAPTFEPIISESVKAWDSYSEMSEKHGAKLKAERTRPALEDTPEGVDRRPTNKPRRNEPQWAGAGNLFTRSTRATQVNPEASPSSSSTPDLITPPTTRTAIPSIVYSFRLPAESDLAWIPEEVPSSFEDTIDKQIAFEPLWRLQDSEY